MILDLSNILSISTVDVILKIRELPKINVTVEFEAKIITLPNETIKLKGQKYEGILFGKQCSIIVENAHMRYFEGNKREVGIISGLVILEKDDDSTTRLEE